MKTIFTNCIILDGSENMEPIFDKAIVVVEDKIEAIIDATEVQNAAAGRGADQPSAGRGADQASAGRGADQPSAGRGADQPSAGRGADQSAAKIIDLGGKYVMPGLINLHVHLALSGQPPKKEKKKPVNYSSLYNLLEMAKPVQKVFENLVARYARTQLLSGVTTVRTVGGLMDFDSKVRDKIDAGKIPGPRILCANTAVSVPGGHFAGSLGTEAKTPEEAIADIRRIADTNPDLIKIMITGGVMDCEVLGEPGIVKMPVEIVKAACDEAHRLGYKVAAHVESTQGMIIALENGVDTIEHGGQPSPEVIELFKKTGAALISTTSPALPYALFDRSVSKCTEEAHINGMALFTHMCDCTKACLAAGIPVGLGTDASCPFTTHYNTWRELVYFTKYCGASNKLALHTATLGNARIAGLDEITGSIEAGKSADLIALGGNPIEDLSVLRDIDMVMCRGRLTMHPKVEKYAEIDAELDKFL